MARDTDGNTGPGGDKVALVTGAARRIGAAIAETLHAAGFRVILHCRQSRREAEALRRRLEGVRPGSAAVLCAELRDTAAVEALAEQAQARWGRLDVLVNNASSFYPTPLGTVTEAQWDDLLGSNLKAPFFLAQACAPALDAVEGCIINLADVYAERPLAGSPVYSVAKAGVVMLTRALAVELGPRVRVNAMAPGAILWPEAEDAAARARQEKILAQTALRRRGDMDDIARTVRFLVLDAPYMTGQVLTVDGGRSLAF